MCRQHPPPLKQLAFEQGGDSWIEECMFEESQPVCVLFVSALIKS